MTSTMSIESKREAPQLFVCRFIGYYLKFLTSQSCFELTNTMQIVAVVVTYNRPDRLFHSITSLQAQTRPPDSIYVIDNGSTDETRGMMEDRFPSVGYFRSQQNLGGAGGFALAMELFLAGTGEALLLCDDDGKASATMLDVLARRLHDVPFVNALVVDENDDRSLAFTFRQSYGSKKLEATIESVSAMQDAAQAGIVYELACPFNGTLLRRDLIESVGIVSPEMFIWGDELEFMIRAMARKFKTGTAIDAEIRHPRSIIQERRSALFGSIAIPHRTRGHIAFRNSGRLDALRGRRLRGFAGGVKKIAKLCAIGEWRAASIMFPYYIDGLLSSYALPPSRRVTRRAYEAERERMLTWAGHGKA